LKKKIMFAVLGVTVLLLLGIASIGFGDSTYSDEEYKVQKQIIDTFALEVNESEANDMKDNTLKPLFTRDIYDNEIAKENHKTRMKVAQAISFLQNEKELATGDFKPMIFLEGESTVFIAIKHPNSTITLTEFDISGEKPVKVDKQVKEVKSEEA